MKSLVVFGGAVLVAGSSIAGLLQMNKADNQSAGFMSFFSGEDTGQNVRPPVLSLPHVKPDSQTTHKEKSVKTVQSIKIAKTTETPENPELHKTPDKEASTRKLVATLSGKEITSRKAQERVQPVVVNSAAKTRVLKEAKAAKELVEKIRTKGVIAAKKQRVQKLATKKLRVNAKKNIAYENKQRSPRSLVSGQPETPLTVTPKSQIIRNSKTIKPAEQVALLSKKERTDLGKLVKEKKLPSIDVTIEFDYKSADLTARALPQLARIGEALTDGQLANATFVIAGHTDSVGGNKYNMGLSSKRAETVLNYLKTQFKIGGERLLAVGYGEERLKNTTEPRAAENRRVEFITLVR